MPKKNKTKKSNKFLFLAPVLVAAAAVTLILLFAVEAAISKTGFESEDGVPEGGVSSTNDGQASGGSFLQFGSSGGGGVPSNYQENLARIQASTFRNRLEDNSPHRNTPSVDLYDKADLYSNDHTEQLDFSGSYNGEFLYEKEYFPGNGAGTTRSSCEVSHFAYDDPIVFPNQPEVAHLHMFIGNTDTNAYSTYDTMLNSGGSTCNGGELNRTGYWVPAMFNGLGEVVAPSKIKFYYKTEKSIGVGRTAVYPENLQLLGDKTNNIQGNRDVSTFRCNVIWNANQFKTNPSATIPKCESNRGGEPGVVEFEIFFDHCWNGNTSTIGDWKANRGGPFGNPAGNLVPPSGFWFSSQCPSSHPILLPALVTHIFFDVKPGEDTTQWYLSSDVDPQTRQQNVAGGTNAHADWFGAWNKQINQEWIDNCNNGGGECGAGLLADPARQSSPRTLRLRKDWISGWGSPNARIPVQDIYSQLCSASDEVPYNAANGGAMAAYCRPENANSSS